MANRTFVSFWTRDRAEATRLDRFERLLDTVPRSKEHPGFASLTIRAISPAEPPLAEHDFQGILAGAAEILALAREFQAADVQYEIEAFWDIWERDAEEGRWKRQPERLLLTCAGEAFEGGLEDGDFLADVGFEHVYTGHAGILGAHGARSAPSDPVEAEFLALMTHEPLLHEYYERTRENIQQLLGWVRTTETALPIERYRLWSEGEENFEARLDEILAAH
jgi:hypothetical protein